jgi:hypothetical protein
MTTRISAIARRSARSGTIALAALSMLATHVTVQAAPQGTAAGATEFSSQHNPQISAGKLRQGAPRGPVGVPRGPGVPRTNFAPRNLQVAPGGPGPRIRGPVGIPRGPALGFRGPSGRMTFHGGPANFIRGPHRFLRNGAYIPFVALGVLGAITIGSRVYAPSAYVDGPGPDACAGPTDDGMCELRWTEVPLQDGSSAMQCVAYCPQD